MHQKQCFITVILKLSTFWNSLLWLSFCYLLNQAENVQAWEVWGNSATKHAEVEKTNRWVHIWLPGDTSEKQGCNQGSNAILGSSAEESVTAQDDLAALEAARQYLTFFSVVKQASPLGVFRHLLYLGLIIKTGPGLRSCFPARYNGGKGRMRVWG